MRPFYQELRIDDQPVLAPDGDVVMELTDLDSAESGRDEAGFLHRLVVRRQVGTWELCYSTLTEPEYRYMESLFAGKDTVQLTYRGREGAQTCTAYRSSHGITLRNARTGLYGNYKFRLIQC